MNNLEYLRCARYTFGYLFMYANPVKIWLFMLKRKRKKGFGKKLWRNRCRANSWFCEINTWNPYGVIHHQILEFVYSVNMTKQLKFLRNKLSFNRQFSHKNELIFGSILHKI
ncbi:hypothetical protein RF11_13499 [Thelohanellus kitauei]|uniref:Uncharacterized protein n=1 Tax=Thelohanellus kitauei TaxID=669202 RepID=A0A0C2NCF5_THEKT|nr:hypothetical protein RF11_13499 [Thelohanellus kitauei]